LLVVGLSAPAFSADVAQALSGYARHGRGAMVTATFTVTADGSGNVAAFSFLKPADIDGRYLFTVEAYSSTDAAFTVTIETENGSPLFSEAWSAAIAGEALKSAADRWPIYDTPTIDVTGLTATEVCTVIVTFVGKGKGL